MKIMVKSRTNLQYFKLSFDTQALVIESIWETNSSLTNRVCFYNILKFVVQNIHRHSPFIESEINLIRKTCVFKIFIN